VTLKSRSASRETKEERTEGGKRGQPLTQKNKKRRFPSLNRRSEPFASTGETEQNTAGELKLVGPGEQINSNGGRINWSAEPLQQGQVDGGETSTSTSKVPDILNVGRELPGGRVWNILLGQCDEQKKCRLSWAKTGSGQRGKDGSPFLWADTAFSTLIRSKAKKTVQRIASPR